MLKRSADGQRLKVPTTCLVLHKSGDVEINCQHCKQGVIVPLQLDTSGTIRKSTYTRHTLRRTL